MEVKGGLVPPGPEKQYRNSDQRELLRHNRVRGISSACGNGGCGTIFRVLSGGTLTALHNFDSTDGDFPTAGVVQATNGNFYGTTSYRGTSTNCSGAAVQSSLWVWALARSWKLCRPPAR